MALPVRVLKLSESADRELERNLWSDRFVDAAMRSEGQTGQIQVRYRGGHTREYPKRSYEVRSNGEAIHYNAEYDDPSIIRNALSFAFFPMIGVPAPHCRHVLLFRNEDPLGVYLEIEGVGKPYFRRRRVKASALFYAINDQADFGVNYPGTDRPKSSLLNGYEYRFGGSEERKRFANFIRNSDEIPSKQSAAFFENNLDVDNYLRWLAGAVLTGNYDGFEQNYAVYRHRGTGKYRIIPWDYEGTWGRNCYGKYADSAMVAVTGYNQLTKKLLDQRSYRLRYRNILRQALQGPFTEKKLMPIVGRMSAAVSSEIRQDRMRRWSYAEFLGEPELIRRYIRERREIVSNELKRLK